MNYITGAFLSTQPQRNLELIKNFLLNIKIVSLDNKSGQIFGEDYSFLKKKGRLTSEMDLMIANIAKKHNLAIVTKNLEHFKKIPHLKVEEW